MPALTAIALTTLAIVAQDATPLRAAPSASAANHAQLWQGELLEVRGSRLDHLQVYDHRRERAGYVRASQVRVLPASEAEAPQLLAVLRFLRDTPGAESLGIAYVAGYLKAAPAGQISAEPFDALGVMAERLARRAGGKAASATTTAHLEVVAQYGVTFMNFERQGTMQLCYDGEAFRRVVAMAATAGQATPAQQARAALALTRHDCIDPALPAHERQALDRWRAGLLDNFDPATMAQLDEVTLNRLRLRRAGVWSAIAFGQSRRAESAQAAAQRALDELAAVDKRELGDDEQTDYAEAAIRVGAVRWAALPAAPAGAKLQVRVRSGEPGQTCVGLVETARPAMTPAAERCTYATVWAASAAPRADGRALALTVQPLEGWSELWVWRKRGDGWTLEVLPPAAAEPGLGYVEFAGWVPGAVPKLLLVREARIHGKATRRFEVLRAESLTTEKFAGSPQMLAAFGPSADTRWKRTTVSLR